MTISKIAFGLNIFTRGLMVIDRGYTYEPVIRFNKETNIENIEELKSRFGECVIKQIRFMNDDIMVIYI